MTTNKNQTCFLPIFSIYHDLFPGDDVIQNGWRDLNQYRGSWSVNTCASSNTTQNTLNYILPCNQFTACGRYCVNRRHNWLRHRQIRYRMSAESCTQLALWCICFNALRPRQNDRRFTDDTFKRIFLNENVCISIEISVKFVPKGPIEPMVVILLTHICVTRPQWFNSVPVEFPRFLDLLNSLSLSRCIGLSKNLIVNDDFCWHVLCICCDSFR